jgi:hypothetical protein
MERCESNYCGKEFLAATEKASVKLVKALHLPKNAINTMIKGMRSKKQRATLKKQCIQAYCNPGCKNNLFQNGKTMPRAVYTTFKGKNPKARAFFKNLINSTRKSIFGNKTSVLKNSFYKKLSAKNVTRAKKQGALSGCTIKIMT